MRRGKIIFCSGLTNAAKAGQNSFVPARQAQRTSQRKTPFMCTQRVPICLSINSHQGPPLSDISGHHEPPEATSLLHKSLPRMFRPSICLTFHFSALYLSSKSPIHLKFWRVCRPKTNLIFFLILTHRFVNLFVNFHQIVCTKRFSRIFFYLFLNF